ncbi:MAG: exonuclease domain-containing protein, partial [Kangiellaceae bacterium]|nr:exonuclease domain-containing protein [Kangiellaceae bacterium]
HGLTHDEIDRGLAPQAALTTFLEMCNNAIVIAHFHKIERQYIQSLAQSVAGRNLRLKMLDTFIIAKNSMQRRHQAITPSSLRLFNLRQNYGLPFYKAHNALEDALSTAELFLAQMKATNLPLDELILKDFELLEFKN